MAGSIYGNLFRVSTWGESHGKGLGVVIDGCPAGIPLNEKDIQIELDKRKPNQNQYTTKRNENDEIHIMSGTFEGVTTGTPISLMVLNNDCISGDYEDIKTSYRPSHADYTYDTKYNIRDYRGGGRSSGRETVGRVCAGAVAKKILQELDISIDCYVSSVGGIKIQEIDKSYTYNNPMRLPCKIIYPQVKELLDNIKKDNNSIGGTLYCEVNGLKGGIGEPVFDKLDAVLSHGIMSIGGTKGIEFGRGFESGELKGNEYNDEFYAKDDIIYKYSNNSGGILGGISDSSKIYFNIAFKPTPSIGQPQKSVRKNTNLVDKSNKFENDDITIKGRHDPTILPRAVAVVEAMTAITILDFILIDTVSSINKIKNAYKN